MITPKPPTVYSDRRLQLVTPHPIKQIVGCKTSKEKVPERHFSAHFKGLVFRHGRSKERCSTTLSPGHHKTSLSPAGCVCEQMDSKGVGKHAKLLTEDISQVSRKNLMVASNSLILQLPFELFSPSNPIKTDF